jgi:hypothetical protein
MAARWLLLALVPAVTLAVPVPERPPAPPDPARFQEAIGELLDGTRPLESVFIGVYWNDKHGHVTALVHGDGVTFLGRAPDRDTLQLHLSPAAIRRILQLLHDAGFGRMPATVNEGPEKPWLTPSHGEIVVRIQGVAVSRYQAPQRESCVAFVKLAENILDVASAPGQDGVRAASVSDGLDKIVRGIISPRALSLRGNWTSPWEEDIAIRLDGDRLECWLTPPGARSPRARRCL